MHLEGTGQIDPDYRAVVDRLMTDGVLHANGTIYYWHFSTV